MIAKPIYEPVIGLEIHAQLLTESKLFCGCRTAFGEEPNTRTCPVCLGLPGALPVLNPRAVEYAVRFIAAVGAAVRRDSLFSRKNYFYPDLPKGYQITQYDEPLGKGGAVPVPGFKPVPLDRIHLEEDAGKLIHGTEEMDFTDIDFNRCGVPLVEIVTEPVINSPDQAHAFLKSLRQILRYLGICSGDMEKGALRCDANVSVRVAGRKTYGVRTEIKNMNSFRAVERALACEIDRQRGILDEGGDVLPETRFWDEDSRQTIPLRGKEEAEDYRYFPEPDLAALLLSDDDVSRFTTSLPEMPQARARRFVEDFDLPQYDATVLCETKALAGYFETVADYVDDKKLASNWVMVEILGAVAEEGGGIESFPVPADEIGRLLNMIEKGTISGKIAKRVGQEMQRTGKTARKIVEEQGLEQITDLKQIREAVEAVLRDERDQVAAYRAGKRGLFGFFVGQVMKATDGRANPRLVNQILGEMLDES